MELLHWPEHLAHPLWQISGAAMEALWSPMPSWLTPYISTGESLAALGTLSLAGKQYCCLWSLESTGSQFWLMRYLCCRLDLTGICFTDFDDNIWNESERVPSILG